MKFNFSLSFFKKKVLPGYTYDERRYSNTFLIKNSVPRQEESLLPRKIFVFWTGNNPMSENRKRSISQLNKISDIEVCLVTPDNLDLYILPNFPLHPAYEYLSLVHKADYLRCYFMNFYGGGYSDIKSPQSSWLNSFKFLESNQEKYVIGYPEQRIEDIAQVGGILQQDLEENYSSIIGNGAYICRSNTPFTNDWYAELWHRMDFYQDKLKEYPGNIMGDNEGYPIAWTEILGDIFHPLCLKYHSRIMIDGNLRPICHNYR